MPFVAPAHDQLWHIAAQSRRSGTSAAGGSRHAAARVPCGGGSRTTSTVIVWPPLGEREAAERAHAAAERPQRERAERLAKPAPPYSDWWKHCAGYGVHARAKVLTTSIRLSARKLHEKRGSYSRKTRGQKGHRLNFNSILDERSHSIAIFAFFFRYFSSTRPNEFFQIQAYLIHWFRLLALLFSL
jgi:hypothetical protein